MTLAPDDDFAAAEFALGTLAAGERASLAARRLREPELDAAIRGLGGAPVAARRSRAADRAARRHSRGDRGPHPGACRRRRRRTPSLLICGGGSRAGASAAIAASSLAAVLAVGFAAREATPAEMSA